MLQSGQNEVRRKRRSCTSYGCIAVLVIFVIQVGLIVSGIVSGFVVGRQCRIPLPDGSGYVIYMARLNKIICAEWDRKVRIKTNSMHSPTKWIPGDTAGGSPVNAYWYPAQGTKGPYLRFQDPLSEYLVDIRHGKALLIVRFGSKAYAGEVLNQYPSSSTSSGSACIDGKWTHDEVEVEVDGHPAHKLESWVASQPGQYIGCISHSYRRFISSKEAPEQPIQQR